MFDTDPIVRIEAALRELASEDRREWTAGARSERVLDLVRVRERVQAALVRAAGEWDAGQDWALDGTLSAPAWLAYRAPVTKSSGARLMSQARLCHEYEATGQALADGAISCAHVEVLAPMIRDREAEYERAESVMLDAARDLSPDAFGVAAHHWRNAADDALSQLDAAVMSERRNVHVSTTLGGMGAIVGDLDPDGTATVLEAFELAAPPDKKDRPEPPRTLGQRQHDALVDICAAFIAARAKGGRVPAGLNVTMDHDTAAGHPPADPCDARCELSRFGPIPLATAQRLACDCAIGRIVMSAEGEILDQGRRERFPIPSQRRAVEVRDRHCARPGCDRPVESCDAHHIVWWERGGETNLDNLCLLCRRHHVLCHEGGWTLQRNRDGAYDVTPPPPTYVRRRRRGRAPPLAA